MILCFPKRFQGPLIDGDDDCGTDGDDDDAADGENDDDDCSKSHQERDAGFLDGGIGPLSPARTISQELNLFRKFLRKYGMEKPSENKDRVV